MPENKKRLERYETYVKVLADRLAIAMANVADAELDAFFDGLEVDFDQVLSHWVLGTDEVSEELRRRWRQTGGYAHAQERIRKMLRQGAEA